MFEDHTVEEHLAGLGCAWQFNVERAPWWGGAFLRGSSSQQNAVCGS